ncbi:MAG: uroporphyrinogen decarboxylase family protein [Oscillospiraceae bacterium]|nr:uroporphyrinogen decarboxylase family protein [Oscillospiraceae bacterium]
MELLKLEMTPRERLLAYAKGEEVDRIPTSLSAGETAPPLYGYDISEYYFSADAMVAVESGLARDFGADNMGMGLGLRTLVEALGTKMAYPKANVSYIQEPGIKDLKDIENKDIVNVEKDGRFPIIIEAFDRLLDLFGNERIISSGLAGPFTSAAELYGTEKFLKATIKDKDGVHRLLQYTTDCVVQCCKDLNKKLGIKFTLSEPMGSRNLISKKQFEEFFIPYIKQTIIRLNEFQGATGIHICGQTMDRWEDIVNTGISGFWIDNCEDMGQLKTKYGNHIAISGNLPPVELLRFGTEQEIFEGVKKCILDGADNPCGYTLCPGCTTPVGTTKENMLAFMNASAIFGKGARKGFLPKGVL